MRRLLVLSGGHPYEAEPFAALLTSLAGWAIDHRVHPEAEETIAGGLAGADAVLFYDMGGYSFADGTVVTRPPSDAFKAAILAYFAAGKGAVALHHALAGWAEWPEWHALLGTRFRYQADAGELDSGYRHDVDYQVEVVAPDHPVTAGLPSTFTLCDELYLTAPVDGDAVPLLRARHAFTPENFYSAAHAVAGRMFDNSGWAHAPGNDLIGWERRLDRGRLVTLQPGDGPTTYADPQFRRLLANALAYVAD